MSWLLALLTLAAAGCAEKAIKFFKAKA